MTNPFKDLVRRAAPVVPDADNTRRTNRALMQDRIRKDAPRRRLNYRLGLAAAGLALVVVFSGQVEEVGSDAWDLEESSHVNLLGSEKKIFSRPFSGRSITSQKSMSSDQARDILISELTGEYEILRVTGLEIHGKTHWLQFLETTEDGKPTKSGRSVDDPASQTTPDHYNILTTDLYREIMASPKHSPDHEKNQVTLDGISYEVKTWVFPDTPYGTVKYHLGLPIR